MMKAFEPGLLENRYGLSGDYAPAPRRPGLAARLAPAANFYLRLLLGPLAWLSRQAKRGRCDDGAWVHGSNWLGEILESSGFRLELANLDAVAAAPKPCIYVANHMSTLETFLLPGILRPAGPVTFVVKDSLVRMPFFGAVMRSRQPVVVRRQSPREDLETVFREGRERLERGISLVIFPQSTRSAVFEPEHFNSIGMKLAVKARVPVVPIALKTDAWGNGARIKECGPIRPDLPVRFRFGEAVRPEGNGRREHAEICSFIASQLEQWQRSDGVNRG